MYLPNLVLGACVEEDTLRRRGLASVNVSDDTEVAHFLERIIAIHRGS
jgi:hypothetical protein